MNFTLLYLFFYFPFIFFLSSVLAFKPPLTEVARAAINPNRSDALHLLLHHAAGGRAPW